jgi:riboflavin synthase alpha subunit
MSLIDLNANLRSAAESGKRITFEYSSDSRAIARFNRKPSHIDIDGAPLTIACVDAADCAVLLPRGTHQVIASAQ